MTKSFSWSDRFQYTMVICVFLHLTFISSLSGQENDVSQKATFSRYMSSHFEFTGYIENESAYRLNDPERFTKIQNLLQLEWTWTLTNHLDLYNLTWIFYDAAYDIDQEDFSTEIYDEYRSNVTADRNCEQIIREIYLDLYLETVQVRLGKQQVVWGEAIGLRITDIVNPQDFREFILDDFIDSRIPIWMAKIDVETDFLTISALWIPDFEPARFALPGSEWEFTFNKPDLAPDMNVDYREDDEPAQTFANSEAGLRCSIFVGGWDLSAYYFYGWDDWSTVHSHYDPSTNTITFSSQYHQLQTYGFTFAKAVSSFVSRVEAAYTKDKYLNTAAQNATEGVVQKDFVYYLLGLDYTVSDYLFNIQFIQKRIFDYEQEIYEDRLQDSLSFWAQANFINETVRPELLLLYSANDGAWLIRPKILYKLTDYVSVTLGGDVIEGGDERSFFGQFDQNDRLYLEFKWSF
ncbi:DUF1302 family protein [candidate division CSSED10-310 bacterium]|uniref:DUF1302 family protein n=1 Tax=candidate division CSSED10-310 bacterium TaxID=2855610 RepID=A0ABV6Z4K9_UNCC1